MGDSELSGEVLRGAGAYAKAYLLDLDGTLYADGRALPGAVDTLARLRSAGTPFRLVTNTTSRSRAMLVERLRRYGFAVGPDELFTATMAGAAVARGAGYEVLAPFTPPPAHVDFDGFELMGGTTGRPVSRRPDAVVVGDLAEEWSYDLLQEAFEYLLAGAALIALSRDRYWRRGDRLALDAGPFVVGLEYAAGVTATVAGKPSEAYYRAVLGSLGRADLKPDEVAMVGDDLWSDVQGAQRAGIRGWLVRTGKFREEALAASGVVPDRIIASVAELGDA